MEVNTDKKVAFYTLGCKVNQYDTEAMLEMFTSRGYRVVDFEDMADVYVINTCTVTNVGDRKSRQMIRRAKKNNPGAIIAVVGCYAQRAAKEVLEIPGVNIALGTGNRNRIVEMVDRYRETQKPINGVQDIMNEKEFEEMEISGHQGKTRAVLKIQEGCNQFCTYCIIPYARGPVRSRKPADVIAEVDRLSAAGFREIVLTGIHLSSYGKDLDNAHLLSLLRDIHDIDGIARIRLGSLEPTILTTDFIKELKCLDKVCNQYHLSLQSGCDDTLERMKRRYTTNLYSEIVKDLRMYIPDVAITTDIMVGFPGETQEEFDKTYSFVKDMEFSKIHVFQYSKREGTPAASFNNQISREVKESRSKKLVDLGNKMEENYMKSFIGKEVSVLLEEENNDYEGYYVGYTEQYIKVAVKKSDDYFPGQLIKTTVFALEPGILLGK